MSDHSSQSPFNGANAPHPEHTPAQPCPDRAAIMAAVDAYTARGWAVFPLIAGGKTPANKHGFHDATSDPQKAHAIFAQRSHRSANIGIATGVMSGGLLVLDTDDHEGKDGEARLAELETQHEPLPLTYTVLSGGGSVSGRCRHRYFQLPEGVHIPSRNGVLAGFDVKADRGYVVAPPSITTVPPCPPDRACGPYTIDLELAIAPAPQWLIEWLTDQRSDGGARMNGHANGVSVDNSDLSAGILHDWRYDEANEALLTDILARVELPDLLESDYVVVAGKKELARLGWLGGVTALKQFYVQYGWPIEVMHRLVDAYSARATGYADAVARGVARAKFDEVRPDGRLDIGALINSAKRGGWKWPKRTPRSDTSSGATHDAQADATQQAGRQTGKEEGAAQSRPGQDAGRGNSAPALDLTAWHAVDTFAGQAQRREWLVDGVFATGQAALVAAAGGVGKSYLALELCRACAAFDPGRPAIMQPMLFGGPLARGGSAVYLSGEDDRIELHNRLAALGPIPARLYAVPLVDAGGVRPLFALHTQTRIPHATEEWGELERQLAALPNLAIIVFDPLQAMVALDLNVAEYAQYVAAELAKLAAETGAAVIVAHHFAKRGVVSDAAAARDAVRGSGGLVDGVRCAYALWPMEDDMARTTCEALGEAYERGKVVNGGVVKANGRATLGLVKYVRNVHGLLVDRNADLAAAMIDPQTALAEAIMAAARAGRHFTRTGQNGVFARHDELPPQVRTIAKHRLERMVDDLLADHRIAFIQKEGDKRNKWLGAPDSAAQGSATGRAQENNRSIQP